ncbi:MAG: glycosyltransferase family 9 protein [Gemmatimonadota bacterium]
MPTLMDTRGPRFAVFQPGRAGDFILTTALFNAIKEAAPASVLTVIAGPRAAELAAAHPAIDETLVFDRSPGHMAGLIARLWSRPFDAWIDPKTHFSRSSRRMAILARARSKVGFSEGGGWPFSLSLSSITPSGSHFVHQALMPLRLLGLPEPAKPRVSLGLTPAAEEWARLQLTGTGEWTTFLNISAGSGSRVWPIACWLELLPRLARYRPTTFLLSSAPEDASQAASLATDARALGVSIRQVPRSGLLSLAALIRRVNMVLTVDTSIVHIAAAFDRPLVALYIQEFPAFDRFQPLSSQHEVVASPRGSPMSAISVERVEQAYVRLAGVLSSFRF